MLGETSGCWCRRADSGRSQGRSLPRSQLTPRLSETRSDDQELREADAARRWPGDGKCNEGEGWTSEIHGEPTRKESSQRQDQRRNQQHQEAEIHEHCVLIHPTLALIEAAKPGAENKPNKGSYRRPTPPGLQEVTWSHGFTSRQA